MNTTYIFWIVFALAFLAGFIIVLIIVLTAQMKKAKQQRWKEQIEKNSKRIIGLRMLNMRMPLFYDLESNYNIACSVQTKVKLERFDFVEALRENIITNKTWYDKLISTAQANETQWKIYSEMIMELPPSISEEESINLGIPHQNAIDIENEMLYLEERTPPVTSPSITWTAYYTSPQGRNSYNNSMYFDFGTLLYEYRQAFIVKNEKQIRRESVEYERSIMTSGLRYDVLKRDNFRCVLCGRSQKDGVTLHVDHIVPVSRGGKTVMNNLRTLCEDCNRGKGAKYDPFGLN